MLTKALVCCFGSPWLDHFSPPIGTGKGCSKCDEWLAEIDGRLAHSASAQTPESTTSESR